MLPADVRVLAVDEMPAAFHARYGAREKTYRYSIENGDIVSPFAWRYVWHVTQPLAVEPMVEAARAVEGPHDFAAFQAAGSATTTTERTVVRSVLRIATGEDLDWLPSRLRDEHEPRGGRLLVYEITGNGFLRHMVRTIVGTLAEIGGGRRAAGAMAAIVASRDRQTAGPTAPACGLSLVGVRYDP